MFFANPGYSQTSGSPVVTTATTGTETGTSTKRSRVFIDPLTEIPRLERWFADDTHPSSYVIEKYTEELNRSPYRQRFPRLEPKNLQLWFKNHRAKMKRQRDACMAAAAAAAAAAASSSTNGGGADGDGRTEQYRHGEMALPGSGGVDAARAFQKGDHSNVDGGGGQHDGGLFQTSTGRCFSADDRQNRSGGGFFDQAHVGSSGGSALDELVLRLRSGPLGRLPETTALHPTSSSCDE